MLSYVGLDLPEKHLSTEVIGQNHRYPSIRVYIDTAVVVVMSYLSLLTVNAGYIVLAIFPFIALGFIVALCRRSALIGSGNGKRGDADPNWRITKPRPDSGSEGPATEKGEKKTMREAEQLKAISVGPYLLLGVMGRLSPENLAVSRFLLFLSITLGTLMLMMIRLPAAGVAPGVKQASELLRKTSLVALLVTVHTMAAELLGENVVLFLMPELVPALLWFSLNIDRDSPLITVDRIKLHKNGLVFLGAPAVIGLVAYLATTMDESGVYRCVMTSVSCGVSGLLVYYVVFMLRQWPAAQGTATDTSGVYSLEEFWAIFLLVAAAALVLSASVAAVRLGLHEQAVPALHLEA
uniref:Uncharacterized protein n=1 Tax=Oryza meridionalis TaxID=40149 RepID=A0A0E0C1J0_9ORYZ